MSAKAGMRARTKATVSLAALVLLLSVSCKTETEGAAAAKDLASTASDLQTYYADLSTQVSGIIQLAYLDEAVNSIPFAQSDETTLSGIRDELNKRAELAQTVSKLAATYAALAGSTSATDASTAASKFGTELQSDLTSLKVLPSAAGGAIGAALPSALSEAAKLALSYAQTKDLKTCAKTMQKSVEGLEELFGKEVSAYESLAQTRIDTAARLAEKLISQNNSDLNPIFTPAMQPFGFAIKQAPAGEQYAKVAVREIKQQAIDQTTAFNLKTSGISKSLQKSEADLTTVITGKKATGI